MANDTDKQNLEKLIVQMKKLIATYPATASYINPKITQVEGELAQYASGKVKYEGEWMERTAHQREKAEQIVALIKADISRTRVASDYDMQSDPRYQALLAMKDTSVAPLLNDLVAFYDKKDRADQRTKLLAELNSKDTTFSEAQTSVMALKSLKPDEDPNAESFLKSWDASADAFEKITRSLKNTTAEFEKLFATDQIMTEFPVLPEALAKELPELSQSITDYQATKYPPQLELPPDLSASIKDFAKTYPPMQKKSGRAQAVRSERRAGFPHRSGCSHREEDARRIHQDAEIPGGADRAVRQAQGRGKTSRRDQQTRGGACEVRVSL